MYAATRIVLWFGILYVYSWARIALGPIIMLNHFIPDDIFHIFTTRNPEPMPINRSVEPIILQKQYILDGSSTYI